MTILALLPNVEELVVTWLTPILTAANSVSTRLPAEPNWPAVTVQRVAGGPSQDWEDSPLVQIDCWGALETSDTGEMDAYLLGQTVIAHRGTLLRAWTLTDGNTYQVTGVDVSSGPNRATDPDTGRPRYIVDLLLTVSPLES